MDEEGKRSHQKMIALCMRIEQQHRIIIYIYIDTVKVMRRCVSLCVCVVVLEKSEKLLLTQKIITQEEIITHCCVPHPLSSYIMHQPS